ncbi:MAG: hypothetical protein HYT93_03635 [Parcubacteria group bacterium]|nr:hypothetical protein [Parcubacteria group bacterium]
MQSVKQYLYIFIFTFVLNVLWEHAHSLLYVHYKGGAITELILFRAALFDAAVITLVAFIFLSVLKVKYGLLAMVVTLVVFAAGLELWALETSRWAYTSAMPLVPLVSTGLTPTIQLGILGYISITLATHVTSTKKIH